MHHAAWPAKVLTKKIGRPSASARRGKIFLIYCNRFGRAGLIFSCPHIGKIRWAQAARLCCRGGFKTRPYPAIFPSFPGSGLGTQIGAKLWWLGCEVFCRGAPMCAPSGGGHAGPPLRKIFSFGTAKIGHKSLGILLWLSKADLAHKPVPKRERGIRSKHRATWTKP